MSSAIPRLVERTCVGKVTLFHKYHAPMRDNLWPLQSLFVPVGATDVLRLVFGDGSAGTIVNRHWSNGGGSFVPPPSEDVCLRAVEFVKGLAVGPTPTIRIEVDKGIPIGAGMGGGSADGACVVRTLEAVLGVRAHTYGARDLAALSFDVPAFALDGPCYYDGDPRHPISLPDAAGFDLYAIAGPVSVAPLKTTRAIMSRLTVDPQAGPHPSFSACIDAFERGDIDAYRLAATDLRGVMSPADRAVSETLIKRLQSMTGVPFFTTGTGPYVTAPIKSHEISVIKALRATTDINVMVVPPASQPRRSRCD